MIEPRPLPRLLAPATNRLLLLLFFVGVSAAAFAQQPDRPPPPPPPNHAPFGNDRPPPPPPPPPGWNAGAPNTQPPAASPVPPATAVTPEPTAATPAVVEGSVADLENKLADARRSNDSQRIDSALIRLADAQLQAGQSNAALPLLDEAVNLADRYDDDAQGREAALMLAKAYVALGDTGMSETWTTRAEQFRERIERRIAPLPEATAATSNAAPAAVPVVASDAQVADVANNTRAPTSHNTIWLWLLLPAFLLLAWAWLRSQRKADDLQGETERLARHQKHLRNAHENLQQQAEHLRQTATQDALTGALTRQAFANDLAELLHHAQHYGKPVAFLLFDLDHFKAVNDTYGHLAGDIALKMVAGVVRENLESKDLFGRFGGDEFLIACMDGDATSTPTLAENIRASVRKHALDGHDSLHEISVSIGIAIADREQGYEMAALFSRADTALYAAKRAGRDCVRLADANLATPPGSEFPLRSLAATPNDI